MTLLESNINSASSHQPFRIAFGYVKHAPLLLLVLAMFATASSVSASPTNPGEEVVLPAVPLDRFTTNEHDVGESYVFMYIHHDRIDVRLEIATKDLNEHLGFGFGEEDVLWSEDDVNRNLDSVFSYIDPLWSLSVDDAPLEFAFDSVKVRYAEGLHYLLLFHSTPISARPDEITVDYRILFDYDRRHRGLVVVTQDFESGTIDNGHVASLFLGVNSSTQILDLKGGSWLKGFWTFIVSGAWHIWIGIDHILFLLALLFPAVLRRDDGEWVAVEKFKPALINVVKIVSVFTVAHSITLISAALGVINLPSHIVESIIAFSIAVAAFDILRPVLHKRILIVVFIFGLFHGFGFANVLGHVGLTGRHLLLSLLGFNIGVELGQLAIVVAAFPVLFFLRKTKFYRKIFLPLAAVALIALSLLWVVERLFGFDIRIKETVLGFLGMGK